MQQRQVATLAFLLAVCAFAKPVAGQSWAGAESVCEEAALGQVSLQDSFVKLMTFGNDSLPLAELGLVNLSSSRATRMFMLSVFEHSCGTPAELEKVTLRSKQAPVPDDAAMNAALDAAKETVDITAGLVIDIVNSVSNVRKELGQWRSEIEKWTEEKIDDYTLKVAKAATAMALLDINTQNLYHLVKDSVDIQLEVLDETFGTNCRSLQGALRRQCEDEQLDAIKAVREEMMALLQDSTKKLQKLIEEAKRLLDGLDEVTALSNNYANRIRDHLNDKDGWLSDQIDKLRTAAYAGCVASAVFPPAIPVCYGIAVGVIEGKKVPEMKQALQKTKDGLNKLASSFDSLSQKSDNLRTLCLSRVTDMTRAETSMESTMVKVEKKHFYYWKTIVRKQLRNLSKVLQQNLDNMQKNPK